MCAPLEPTELFRELLRVLDPNPHRGGLHETPARAAKAYQYLTNGHEKQPAEVLKCFEDGAEDYDSMVFQANIPIYSFCEHHVLPFFGVAHIGYIPSKKIVGLSKLTRLVRVFAQRLQVQERITTQVTDALMEHLDPRGVGVVLRCRHLCMEMRGVQTPGTLTYTSCLRGDMYRDASTRSEFMDFVLAADKDLRV